MNDRVTFGHQEYELSWTVSSAPPRDRPVVQASAVCFVAPRRVVLISLDRSSWGLPGGHVESGETPDEAMRREVWEEASAEVLDAAYLGAARVRRLDDRQDDFYQTRFWAHVRLDAFRPTREARHREIFDLDEVVRRLSWSTRGIADAVVEAARQADEDYDYEEGTWRRPPV